LPLKHVSGSLVCIYTTRSTTDVVSSQPASRMALNGVIIRVFPVPVNAGMLQAQTHRLMKLFPLSALPAGEEEAASTTHYITART